MPQRHLPFFPAGVTDITPESRVALHPDDLELCIKIFNDSYRCVLDTGEPDIKK